MNQELKERLNKISLTHYLKITGKWKRKKVTIWLETVFHEKLIENNIRISDLINQLVEDYLKEMDLLNVEDFIEKEKIEKIINR